MIREERKFETVEQLALQIGEDVETARRLLAKSSLKDPAVSHKVA